MQELGNTVVVVEHDEDIIRAADYIIDIGPLAGRLGGEVVYQGGLSRLPKATRSYTMRYLTGESKIELPANRRKWNQYIEVEGAAEQSEIDRCEVSPSCYDRCFGCQWFG